MSSDAQAMRLIDALCRMHGGWSPSVEGDGDDYRAAVELVQAHGATVKGSFRAPTELERLQRNRTDLLAALKLVVSDIEEYERVNNLAPNPSRTHCWNSVARAHAVIAAVEGRKS